MPNQGKRLTPAKHHRLFLLVIIMGGEIDSLGGDAEKEMF